MANGNSMADSGSCLYALADRRRSSIVFVNKIQVKGEEQKIEGQKVCDAADTSFHG